MIIYNHFHNIWRFFNVLTTFLFTKCAIITYNNGIYELPHDLPNDLRLRILKKIGNIMKVSKLYRMIAYKFFL